MRADARRNRERLLAAATAMVLEVGGEPAREAVAGRAGVGIATLYRHFPDQQSLLGAVARRVLEGTIAAGESILERDLGGDRHGMAALRAYMHAAVDAGLGAVNIVHPLLEDPAWPELRSRAEDLLDLLVAGARADGLRDDATSTDIALAIIRACRPLGTGLAAEEDRAQAHRHVDLVADGLARPPSDGADVGA